MMIYDNPAERLYVILHKGKEISLSCNCEEAWRELLCVPSNNEVLLDRLGKVMTLPLQIVDVLNQVNHGSQNRAWLDDIGRAFINQKLDKNWSSFISHIPNNTLDQLATISSFSASTIQTLDQSTLADISEAIDSLYNGVMQSTDLEQTTKLYLTKRLQKISHAIDEYHVLGIFPVMEDLESIIGHGVLYEKIRKDIADSELERIWNVIFKVSAIISAASGLPELTTGAMLLLSS